MKKITLKELRNLVRSEVRKTLRENVGREWEPEFYGVGLDDEAIRQAKAVWERIKDSYFDKLNDLVDYKWFSGGEVRAIDPGPTDPEERVYDTVYDNLAAQIKRELKSED